MAGGTFASVANADNQFTFRDIKVQPKAGTTFRWSGRWVGGITPPAFEVKILQANGSAEKTYYWKYARVGTQSVYEDIACWVKYEGGAFVDLTDAELDEKFDAGQAFWIKGAGHSLQPAGRVDKRPVDFPMNAANYTAVGNGTPVELTLGDLSVVPKAGTTFRWSGRWVGGITPPALEVKFLLPNGTADKTYYWKYARVGTQAAYEDVACWVKYEGSAFVDVTQEELDEVKIPAGKGLWVKGAGHTLHIPSPLPAE